MSNIKVTVVTVVFNDHNNITKTIESVINQTFFKEVEYIVIDAKSNDGTWEIIKGYHKYLDIFESEADSGIYDAMNKAIAYARGEWIVFMNSGDKFYSDATISLVMSSYDGNSDIIYGDMVDASNMQKISPRNLNLFWKGMPFNHQSTFTKTDLYKKRPFSLKYKISSVFDFYYYYYSEKKCFQYLNQLIAIYDMNGISALSLNWVKDYIFINLKYSKSKFHKVIFMSMYIYALRIKNIIKKKYGNR